MQGAVVRPILESFMNTISNRPERDTSVLESFFRSLKFKNESEQHKDARSSSKEKHKSAYRQHGLVPKPSLSLVNPSTSRSSASQTPSTSM